MKTLRRSSGPCGLLIGGSTGLFIVPTVPGVYQVLCTITDHADFGMAEAIRVTE